MRPRALGKSGIVVSPIGMGTNRWGASDIRDEDVIATYRVARELGVDFFDTAELYNGGRSEEVLGACARNDDVIIASKFAPLPHRITEAQFERALDATRARLQRDVIDLYYLHFPYSLVGVATWMDRLANAVVKNKVRAVGVSNCNASRMRAAASALAMRGVTLAANQVRYDMSHRTPETNGVLEACRELEIALVAYRPLGGGALARDGARALAWLLARDPHVIVIPGASRPAHATQNIKNGEASTCHPSSVHSSSSSSL